MGYKSRAFMHLIPIFFVWIMWFDLISNQITGFRIHPKRSMVQTRSIPLLRYDYDGRKEETD